MSGNRSNFSAVFLDSTQVLQSAKSKAHVIIESSFLLTLDAAAFVGNLFILLAIYRNPKLQTVTNIFVINLAISDILMSLLVLPLSCGAAIENHWIFGSFGCILFDLSGFVLAGVSLQTLTLIATNRYVRICKERLYRKIFSRRNVILASVCSWLVTIAFVVVGFPLFGVEFIEVEGNPAICVIRCRNDNSLSYALTVLVIYLVPCILVVPFCYLKVFREIQHHNKMVSCSRPAFWKRASPHGVKEAKLTKLFLAVLLGFCTCWFPAFVCTALYLFDAINKASLLYSNIYWTIPFFASSCVNPLIYITMCKQFADELKRVFYCNRKTEREDTATSPAAEATRNTCRPSTQL